MILENVSFDLSAFVIASFNKDGQRAMDNDNDISCFFEKLYMTKYQNEEKEAVRKDFQTAYGLFQFFTKNKFSTYYLSEIQLWQILPKNLGRFVLDLYAMKLTYFPLCVDVSNLKQLSSENLHTIVRNYNIGMLERLNQQMEMYKNSQKLEYYDFALRNQKLVDKIYKTYSKNTKEGSIDK